MCSLYTEIRKNGGWLLWKMEEITRIECKNQNEVNEIVVKYIEEYNYTLNLVEIAHYNCTYCNVSFKDKFNLERHNQSIKHARALAQENATFEDEDNEYKDKPVVSTDVIGQLTQLTQRVAELSNRDAITSTNCNNNIVNNTINNTTNKFNLNVFLNERCKNALNIDEFLNQLVIKVSDLEETGELGFAPGISRILTNGMKKLDTEQRPIHCTDAKREILYIKNENGWNKDSDRKIMENAIFKVARKNRHLLPEWQEKNPNYNDYDSKENTAYMRIIGNAMVGGTDEEIERNVKKIGHNIAQEVTIPKYG
jgi:hypothetical protein